MSEPQQPAQPTGAPQAEPYGAPQAQPTGAPLAQPYGAPPAQGLGAPQAQPFGAPAAEGNPLGRVAFLIAMIATAIELLSFLITPFLYSSIGFDIADGLATVVGIVVLLGSAVALVLGIVALRRPEPRLLAAIAVGIAVTGVLGRLFAWAGSLAWVLF